MKQKKSMYRAGQASLLSMILLASPVLALANSVPVINADQSVGVIGMVSDSGQGTLSATYNLPWTTVPTMPAIPEQTPVMPEPVTPAPTMPVMPDPAPIVSVEPPTAPPALWPHWPVTPPVAEPVTPAAPLPAPSVPDTSEPIERFVGAEIEAQAHPLTTIMGVTPANGGFAIQASSAISSVSHFVLENDRLVVDIENAVPAANGNGHGHSHSHDAPALPDGVRIGAQEGFTRVVFDMDPVPNYSLQLSADRTRLYVSFVPTVIHTVSVASSEHHDYITLTGDGVAAFKLNMLTANHLSVQLPMVSFAEHLIVNDSGVFNFVTGLTVLPAQNLMAGLSVATSGMVSYTYFADGNSLTIRLSAPTFQNIEVDTQRSVISLASSDWVHLNATQLSMVNNYRQLHHVFTFDTDLSAHFGYGHIPFNTNYSSHVVVQNSDTSQTQIIVYGPNITYAELIQTPTGIDIRTFSPREVYDFIVMLDPGHGGSDPGAIHFGFRESDLALTIGNTLYAWLQLRPNIGVFTTRTEDVDVPLAARAELANGVADLFVSLHLNGFHTGVPNGTETYWRAHEYEYRWPIGREAVAYIFHNNILADLGRANREVRTANFAVLRLTEMPSVLLEFGFLSNYEEMRALTSAEGMQAMAWSTYRSIIEIYELTR